MIHFALALVTLLRTAFSVLTLFRLKVINLALSLNTDFAQRTVVWYRKLYVFNANVLDTFHDNSEFNAEFPVRIIINNFQIGGLYPFSIEFSCTLI